MSFTLWAKRYSRVSSGFEVVVREAAPSHQEMRFTWKKRCCRPHMSLELMILTRQQTRPVSTPLIFLVENCWRKHVFQTKWHIHIGTIWDIIAFRPKCRSTFLHNVFPSRGTLPTHADPTRCGTHLPVALNGRLRRRNLAENTAQKTANEMHAETRVHEAHEIGQETSNALGRWHHAEKILKKRFSGRSKKRSRSRAITLEAEEGLAATGLPTRGTPLTRLSLFFFVDDTSCVLGRCFGVSPPIIDTT